MDRVNIDKTKIMIITRGRNKATKIQDETEIVD